MAVAWVFWLAAGFVLYTYFGYPLLLMAMARLFGSPAKKSPAQPSVTVLVAAHNEEAVIAAKIRNTLNLFYPPERLEIVVASDGSRDATASIVRSLADTDEGRGRVRLLDFPRNRGKVAALNDAVNHIDRDILALSDASSMLAPDAIQRLAENFADPRIGAVSGVYQVLKKEHASLGPQEDFYWKYETWLKVQEARIGGYTGAHGSLYAIRRALYPFPSTSTINDDFVIPMRALQKGYRFAYEPGAVAYEEAQEMEGYTRRVRITAGNIAQLGELRGLIWPLQPASLFCMLSHKVARLLVPLAMVAAFLANVLLWRQPFYLALLAAQVLFYGIAALGTVTSLHPRFLRLPYYFCMINSALFAWAYHALRMGKSIPSRVELDSLGKPPAG
jgi:cellulose synthase/poly-beta-1,6-N-acetylglucosamine synthase-like glycosyltransferase